ADEVVEAGGRVRPPVAVERDRARPADVRVVAGVRDQVPDEGYVVTAFRDDPGRARVLDRALADDEAPDADIALHPCRGPVRAVNCERVELDVVRSAADLDDRVGAAGRRARARPAEEGRSAVRPVDDRLPRRSGLRDVEG